jgi:intracellular septation protein
LTVWFNDEQFIKMKPSIIYLLFGGILGFGLLRGQSYLRMIMQDMIPLKEEGWIVLTRRFAVFFFSLALLNEIIWRFFSTEMWVYFKTFGLTIALFAFFVLQGSLLNKYAIEKKE